MVNRRKRVHAIHRGPDGSAFHKCESCGISVPIALDDMHECEIKKKARKKLKTPFENDSFVKQSVEEQPRSAFRFFMEEFMKTCRDENEVEIDKKGSETWKNMSKEERLPFVLQADKVNSAYEKLLHKEEQEIQLTTKQIQLGLEIVQRVTRTVTYITVLKALMESGSRYLDHSGPSTRKIYFDRVG